MFADELQTFAADCGFGYEYTCIDGKVFSLCGFSKVLAISTETIQFLTKKKAISVRGKNLRIKTLTRGEVVVVGEIFAVEVIS